MRMRKTKRIYKSNFLKVANTYLKQWVFLCNAMSYFLGLIIGAMNLSQVSHSSNYFSLFAEQYFLLHLNQQALGIWQADFLSTLLLLIVLLFCSFSCLGAPVIVAIPCVKGIFSGLLTAALYLKAGKWGILCNIVAFWIPSAFIAAGLIFFSGISLKSSLNMFRNLSKQQVLIHPKEVKSIFQKFLYTGFFILLLCILQTFLTALLGSIVS